MPWRTGSPQEVFRAFAKLGLTAFGGPVAHLGYFRREFVERRAWLSDAQFAQLVALSQFLPGPASSQLGFAIGLRRAGMGGALAAFVAFTLPSALLLFAFGTSLPRLQSPFAERVLHGLALAAVAIVAHGVTRMAQRLTPDLPRAVLALVAATVMLLGSLPWLQLAVIVGGALAGLVFLSHATDGAMPASPTAAGVRGGAAALVVAGVLLALALLLPATEPTLVAIAAVFWRAGSLVFGGGHVVLPLLQHATVSPGWVSVETFLTGYGAAQAVPGPMFTLATFLGAQIPTAAHPAAGALVATLAIFAPGFLLLIGALPLWERLSHAGSARRLVAGVNAAVVGLLLAALIDPVMSKALHSGADVAIATLALVAIWPERRSALWALVVGVAGSVAVAAVGGRL
ncbi:MAG: chromate efflux transporter [Gemmatimonadaceae bacterium]|nr:chromate efflux transporter [Gemmatimonadaceae bacterium]